MFWQQVTLIIRYIQVSLVICEKIRPFILSGASNYFLILDKLRPEQQYIKGSQAQWLECRIPVNFRRCQVRFLGLPVFNELKFWICIWLLLYEQNVFHINNKMENSKHQSTKSLKGSNMLNISNNLKSVKLLKKRLTCLECRASKDKSELLLYHVKTRHPEKQLQLLAKECSECNLIFPNRVLYQNHYLAVHDKRTDEEVFSKFDYARLPNGKRQRP